MGRRNSGRGSLQGRARHCFAETFLVPDWLDYRDISFDQCHEADTAVGLPLRGKGLAGREQIPAGFRIIDADRIEVRETAPQRLDDIGGNMLATGSLRLLSARQTGHRSRNLRSSLNQLRRFLRGLCLLVFAAGVVFVLLGAFGVRLRPGGDSSTRSSESKPAVGLGLVLQGLGAAGYLAITSLWPRRSSRRSAQDRAQRRAKQNAN